MFDDYSLTSVSRFLHSPSPFTGAREIIGGLPINSHWSIHLQLVLLFISSFKNFFMISKFQIIHRREHFPAG